VVWQARLGEARRGRVRHGPAWRGRRGRRGGARRGRVRYGEAWYGRQGEVRRAALKEI